MVWRCKQWKRRWVILDEEALYYVHDIDKPTLITNCMLATVREADTASEIQFGFEVLSPNRRTYLLQAENEIEMQEWIGAIRDCTEKLITGLSQESKSSEDSASGAIPSEDIVNIQKANPVCADCASSNPEWASINLGVLLCIECSGIHRSLGVHVSKVRSLTLDSWTPASIALLKDLGNDAANKVWEAELGKCGDWSRPKAKSSRSEKERFIKAKYIDKKFVGGIGTDLSLDEAAATGNTKELMRHIVHGNVDKYEDAEKDTPLHLAVTNGHATCSEMLLQNNGKKFLPQKNNLGMTPAELARQPDVFGVLSTFAA